MFKKSYTRPSCPGGGAPAFVVTADANTVSFKRGLTGTINTKLQAAGINLVHPVTINGPAGAVEI